MGGVRILLRTALLLPVLPMCHVRADTITLDSGATFEGRIAYRGPHARITIRKGWFEIPKGQVRAVEKGPVPWEEYAEKAKALDEGDIKGRLDLAAWCLKKSLRDEAREQYRKALEADPECAGALKGLEATKPSASPHPPEPPPRREEKAEPERKEPSKEELAEAWMACRHSRPVEGLFGPYKEGRNELAPAPVRRQNPTWTYPVNPGSIWTFPWGTVYGPPRVVYGGAWTGAGGTWADAPTWSESRCSSFGVRLRYDGGFAGGRGRLSLRFGD